MAERLGILTGGGDCPGLNALIRAVVRYAVNGHGIECVGILHGWRGLLDCVTMPLDMEATTGLLPRGGTILRTSRTNPYHLDDGAKRVVENVERLNLDGLIAIGGDDELVVARRLFDESQVKVIGIPKTIDNDVPGTEYAFGFDSAVNIAMEAIDRVHTTAESHDRVMVVEVMGRDSGWIGLLGGLAGGADVLLVPESNFSVDTVEQQIRRRLEQGKRFSIVVIAEGAKPQELEGRQVARGEVDAFGHVQLGGVGYWLAEQLKAQGNLEMTPRVTVLAYLQRGGVATPFDRLLATRFGVAAVEFAMEGRTDVMTGLQGTQVVPVPLGSALAGTPKPLDPELLRVARSIGLS